MSQAERGNRQYAQAVAVDEKRILVGAVMRAAILHHPQPARGHLLSHPVVEQNHRIGHVLFQSLAREGALAALGGDDWGVEDDPLRAG